MREDQAPPSESALTTTQEPERATAPNMMQTQLDDLGTNSRPKTDLHQVFSLAMEAHQQEREAHLKERETYKQEREAHLKETEAYKQEREAHQQEREAYKQEREAHLKEMEAYKQAGELAWKLTRKHWKLTRER